MSKNKVTKVKGVSISYHQIDGEEHINLKGIARHKDSKRPEVSVQGWIKSLKTIEFLLFWKRKYNRHFKHKQTDVFKGYEKFAVEIVAGKRASPSMWINYTNAKGLKVIRRKYSGTFA